MAEAGIVNITSLRKKGRRFSVAAVDGAGGRADASLHPDIASDFGVAVGAVFSSERWMEVLSANDFKLAWERTLAILSSGDCDSRGLKRKLKGRGFSAESAERAVAEAARLSLIDDAAFVRRKAESCLARGYGRRKAVSKLLEGGIPLEEAETVLDAVYAGDAETAAARLVAERKAKSLRRSSDEPTKKLEKLKRHLAGKGFSYDIISEVVEGIELG